MSYKEIFFSITLLLVINLSNEVEHNNDPGSMVPEISNQLYRVPRVSGGIRDPNKSKMAKFIVSIRSRTPRLYYGDNHFCSGLILSERFVLTAAQCVTDWRKIVFRPRKLLICCSTSDLFYFDYEITLQVPVEDIYVPLNFTLSNTNDIALLRTGYIDLSNEQITNVNLATKPVVYGARCTVLGWGRVFQGGPISALISHVDVTIMTPQECVKKTKYFMPEMICAGNLQNRIDENPCQGDTGGPLMCHGELVGIISHNIGCGTITLPTIFTDVYYHRDWINKIMNGSSVLKFNLLNLFLNLFVAMHLPTCCANLQRARF